MTTTAQQSQEPSQQQQHHTPQPSVREVLKNRHFLFIWLAQLVSLTIMNAANFGVVVIVNEVTHSVLMSGLAIISFTLPAVPFSAVAGVLVDRFNKRQVLWISNVLRSLVMVMVVISLLINHTNIWPLYVLTFMASLIGQFFTPAESASIPLLVGEEQLMAALSLFNVTMTVSMAIGFLVLGRLISSIFQPFTLKLIGLTLHFEPTDMLFVVVAVLYLACAGLILLIPKSAFQEKHLDSLKGRERSKNVQEIFSSLWTDIVNGWKVVQCDYLLLYSVIQLSVVGVIMLLIGELAGSFVQQVLHRSAADISFIFAPAALGLVGAAVIMPRFAGRLSQRRLATIGLVAVSSGFFLIPGFEFLAHLIDPKHGSDSLWLLWGIVLLMGVLGIAMACVNIPTQTMMQEHAPEESRGRVFSFQFMMYNVGSIPVLLFAGVFAQFLGFELLMVLVGCCLLAFSGWGVWFTDRGRAREERGQSAC